MIQLLIISLFSLDSNDFSFRHLVALASC